MVKEQTRDNQTIDDAQLVQALKATETDPIALLNKTKIAREKVKNGAILFYAPEEVIEGLQRGEKVDKSKIIAANSAHQAEVDRMFHIGITDRVRRLLRRP